GRDGRSGRTAALAHVVGRSRRIGFAADRVKIVGQHDEDVRTGLVLGRDGGGSCGGGGRRRHGRRRAHRRRAGRAGGRRRDRSRRRGRRRRGGRHRGGGLQ